MTTSERLAMWIANCKCCLLAEAMKDCPLCCFNIGLPVEKSKCLHTAGKSAIGKQLQCVECGELFAPRNYAEVGQVELYGHGRSLRGWQKRELYEPELGN